MFCQRRREHVHLTSANTPHTSRFTLQSRHVHTITDRFSMANTYLIHEEHLVVIDPGSELNVRLLSHYLQRFLQRVATDIDLIVLTHLHPDHTAGVEALRQLCRAPVAASAAVRQLAQSEQQKGSMLPGLTHLAGYILPGTLQHLDLFPPFYTHQVKLVDLWLEDAFSLPFHPSWHVIASPGHTPESLCLYNPFTYELLCGDTVITVEGGAPLLHSGTNRRQLTETLHVLRNLSVHYLYPGHGRPILSKNPLENVEVEW
jgi:hydroxyacylglutathione hydrolase